MLSSVFFKTKIFEITYLDLLFSAIILVCVVFLSYFFSKVRRKKHNTKNDRVYGYAVFFVKYFLWLGALVAISFFSFKDFATLRFVETKVFLFSSFDLVYFLLIPVIAILLGKILDYVFFSDSKFLETELDIKRKTLVLIKIILWSFTIEILFSTILRDSTIIGKFELIKLKNISISIYDIFAVLIIISVSTIILAFLRKMMKRRVEMEKMDSGTGTAIFQIVKYIIWIITIVAILQSIGLNLSLILAGSAALLVGLGMGVQNIFNDFISGLILLIERPLKVGDIVEVDSFVGDVKHIGLRTTSVMSRDDILILVPNSKFTSEKVINWSNLREETRFSISIGVSYGSDVEKVMELLYETAAAHSKVSSHHKPFVRFENFGDSSLDFKLFFWSQENMQVENIKSDMRISIDKKFRENNVSIPFPQRDIHIINQKTQ